MLIDDLFDRLAYRFRRSRREGPNESFLGLNGRRTGSWNSGSGQRGFFDNANHFVINQSTLIEHRGQIIQNFVAGTGLDPILERIMTYANLNASVDSSARFPPPTCHPGTRVKIGGKLFTWFTNPEREWNLIWLNGPAGTGKSAVAQTFAERCAEIGRLGASFFFSRLYDRNDPNTVIPTLVYQLAVSCPPYKSLVTAQLTNDPALLRKTRHMQFKKLIVEPFSQLQTQKRYRIRKPLLVVLDGLDECKGENAQKEIIEMIGEVTQLKKDFPLVWLICSRPEPHLKCVFSKADFTVHCGREELAIDAESIADVDFYLRDGLAGIKADFSYVTTPVWPPEEQIAELSAKASGHFGFASTSLRYIGDPIYGTPMSRLDTLLSFLQGVSVGTSNPLETLDALYTAILDDVPKDDLPITRLILGFFIFKLPDAETTQYLCNFLKIDQATFYNAFRKLHSVVDIPSPKAALKKHIRFYHASFEDFLRNPSRSGKLTCSENDTFCSLAKILLSWYTTDLELFHTADGPRFNTSHEHGSLPGLSWVSDDDRKEISYRIVMDAEHCWFSGWTSHRWDKALLSQIRNFDFRYIRADNLGFYWRRFLNKLWEMESLGGIIRAEPQTEVDLRLLEYMKSMVGPLRWRSRPATFSLERGNRRGEYFFLGYGSKAVICWIKTHGDPLFSLLSSERPPSKDQIDAYQAKFGIYDGTSDEESEGGSSAGH